MSMQKKVEKTDGMVYNKKADFLKRFFHGYFLQILTCQSYRKRVTVYLMRKTKFFSSSRTIIFGFAAVIVAGTLLLMLPISSKERVVTPLLDCLFTATSSTCVTGLVVRDTATHWSVFGQFVILIMIQIGGMGIVTTAILATMLSGKKINLMQRNTMQESISAHKIGGIVRLSRFIIITSMIIELTGALILLFVFCPEYGSKGIWMSVFHSISAFCNAGFDLMGETAEYSSLTRYVYNPLVNITVMLLVIVGGIGFLTWDDIRTNKWHIKRYRMQSKVIFCVTAVLIFVPTVYFFFFEFKDLSLGKRILVSLFQSVTPRTAGFNTVDASELSESGNAVVTVLMLIGGAPGSTAGGMKITTIAVLFAAASSVFHRRDSAHILGRGVSDSIVRVASVIFVMYVTLFLFGGMIISRIEGLPLTKCLYETASAIGTVGLTTGITTTLGSVSRIILIFLMYIGRVGGLTIIFATRSGAQKNLVKFPQETITVG